MLSGEFTQAINLAVDPLMVWISKSLELALKPMSAFPDH